MLTVSPLSLSELDFNVWMNVSGVAGRGKAQIRKRPSPARSTDDSVPNASESCMAQQLFPEGYQE